MSLSDMEFKRKFSLPLYKNLKLLLAEMHFAKDFVCGKHGDLYPLLDKSEDCIEGVANGAYYTRQGFASRLMGQFFPYATYELCARLTEGAVGFAFSLPTGAAHITVQSDGALLYACGAHSERRPFPLLPDAVLTLIVSCRPGAFDVYKKDENGIALLYTFKDAAFAASHQYTAFTQSTVALTLSGNVTITAASAYVDNGIAVADMRPIRYENGEVMVSEGKIYFTVSLRMQEEAFQGILSWIPGTAELALSGALFYDAGDGLWANDVAASLLYHREEKRWLLWVCSFAHGHILGHAAFEGDPRFGVNAIDLSLMEKAKDGAPTTAFLGFEGDEDPDFFYDEKEGRWLFAVCRLDEESNQYRYFFFASDSPFENYRFLGKGAVGAETGGSFVKQNGEIHFICGNGYDKRAEYRIYGKEGFALAKFDYDDGGFRGWGTVIPVKMGSRERLFWLTFDRQNGSSYNWSYGNLYCFEAP